MLIILLINLCIDVTVLAQRTGQPPYWWSDPFRCTKECVGITEENILPGTSSDTSECSITCPSSMTPRSDWKQEATRRVDIQNADGLSTCMVIIAKEDVYCELKRKLSFPSSSQPQTQETCRRTNYRYFLDKSCDEEQRNEVGEESCRAACMLPKPESNSTTADTNRVRAIFRPCYRGMVSAEGTRRRMDFCKAELKHCSTCYQWGNWTLSSSCSRTCGRPGVRKYARDCLIMEPPDAGSAGGPPVFSKTHTYLCKAYLKESEYKSEKCGMNNVCPHWTNWESWTDCPLKDIREITAVRNSPNTRRSRLAFGGNISNPSLQTLTVRETEVYGARRQTSTRKRVCLGQRNPDHLACPGNTSQWRMCEVEYQNKSTDSFSKEDSTDAASTAYDDDRTNKEISTNDNMYFTSNVTESTAIQTSTTNTKLHGPKRRNNQTFTVEGEGGFTTVINNYAVILIGSLLVFIVLLLFALIAVCWNVLKRSRRARYPIQPSFSAGTLGSIPSGLMHGFQQPLGLRYGSGTFGRSEYPPNFSDAMSSKGSVRSSSSNATSRGKQRKRLHLSFTSGGAIYSAGSGRQNSKRTRISLAELAKQQTPTSERNMGSKKPSTSSLLSSASSTTGITGVPSVFQPLPPIPPDLPPGLAINGMSNAKRNASRNTGLTPDGDDINSPNRDHIRARYDSVSGRPADRPYACEDGNVNRTSRLRSSPGGTGRPSTGHHNDQHLHGRNGIESIRGEVVAPTENEYWSVAREGESLAMPMTSPMKSHSRVATDSKNRLNSHRSTTSTDKEITESNDSVLYNNERDTEILGAESNVNNANTVLSHPVNIGDFEIGQDECFEEPVYNSIDPTAADLPSQVACNSDQQEGEYDHLYKDSKGGVSPRSHQPSVALQIKGDSATRRHHDYESIELGDDAQRNGGDCVSQDTEVSQGVA